MKEIYIDIFHKFVWGQTSLGNANWSRGKGTESLWICFYLPLPALPFPRLTVGASQASVLSTCPAVGENRPLPFKWSCNNVSKDLFQPCYREEPWCLVGKGHPTEKEVNGKEKKWGGGKAAFAMGWLTREATRVVYFLNTTDRTLPGQAPSSCQQHCLPAVSMASDAPALQICFKIRPDATRRLLQPLLPLPPGSCSLSSSDPFRLRKILLSGNSGNLKGSLDM